MEPLELIGKKILWRREHTGLDVRKSMEAATPLPFYPVKEGRIFMISPSRKYIAIADDVMYEWYPIEEIKVLEVLPDK